VDITLDSNLEVLDVDTLQPVKMSERIPSDTSLFFYDDFILAFSIPSEALTISKYDALYENRTWTSSLSDMFVSYDRRFNTFVSDPLIFFTADGVIYQINNFDGRLIRKIPISGSTVLSMVPYERNIFLNMQSGQVFVISMETARLIKIYKSLNEINGQTFGRLYISNNYMFRSEINLLDSNEKICYKRFVIFQMEIDTTNPYMTRYEYTLDKSSKSPDLEITHLGSSPEKVFNSALYLKPWSNVCCCLKMLFLIRFY
jgi:hypothetical protein